MLQSQKDHDLLHKFVKYPCSDEELQRRWNLAAKAMEENNLDYLLVFQRTDLLGGYVKWFTDWSVQNEYHATVIFSRDKEMSTIVSGSGSLASPPVCGNKFPPDYLSRGVARRWARGYFASFDYSLTFDAEIIVEELAKKGAIRIGLVGKAYMTVHCLEYISKHLTQATIVDATPIFDEIKAVKSPEEIQQVRDMCKLQDEVMYNVEAFIEPGLREYELNAKMRYESFRRGAENGIFLLGSNKMGLPNNIANDHSHGNKVIQKGDYIIILDESNSPSGMYGHIQCIYSLGEPVDELYKAMELCNEAFDFITDRLKPGGDCNEIFNEYNEWLAERGLPTENRLLGHGQGYELIEKPALMPGGKEHVKLKANMNFSYHPTITMPKASAVFCANYIIQENGPPILLHNYPFRKIHII